jgi:hypothetical protein
MRKREDFEILDPVVSVFVAEKDGSLNILTISLIIYLIFSYFLLETFRYSLLAWLQV